jgi:glycine/D-amino acid oxidase-like deaminating enzyme
MLAAGDELDGVFWIDSLPEPIIPRPSLPGDVQVDVAIVGAGYTGLWSAYYLHALDPSLRIVVLDAQVAGFGGSGRNGGWCTGELSGVFDVMPKKWGDEAARAMALAGHDAVDEVGRVTKDEGIDCHFAKGGVVWMATTPKQEARIRKRSATPRRLGFGEEDYRLLDAEQVAARLRSPRARAGFYSPHTAAVQPARLVRGLADVVERNGTPVHERTRVRSIDGGRVETDHGTVTAEVVVRGLEGYTRTIAGVERALVPLQTFALATEPLPQSLWDQIGLADRETFEDARLRIFYGQRTADDRVVLGGMGYPYRYGSGTATLDGTRIHQRLRRTLGWLFPVLRDVTVTHQWGGVIGMPRDASPSVGFDPARRLAWAGGYTGEGVSAANLAGRTIAELICDQETERTRLPWVGHRSRDWEPEPLRWLGVRAGERAAAAVDWLDRDARLP